MFDDDSNIIFEEVPEEVFDALNEKIRGAMWVCCVCGSYFATRISSVEDAIQERMREGCPFCGGGDEENPTLVLDSFLTEEEMSEVEGLTTASALGILKVVPW